MNEIEIEFNDVRKGIKIRLKGEKGTVDSYLEKFGYDSVIKESSQQLEKGITSDNSSTFIL